MTIYGPQIERALAAITKKGGPVVFTAGTQPVYDPATDSFSGGSLGPVTLRAVQTVDDPASWTAKGLVPVDPITLLVAAGNATIAPVKGMPFTWAGVGYTVQDVEALQPDGTPILWTVVGGH